MKNVTDSFLSLGHWPSAGSFGLNTDILATNLINLSVVIGVLIFFGKRVCASCLFKKEGGLNQLPPFRITRKRCIIPRITSI
jgi:hypothetical protein